MILVVRFLTAVPEKVGSKSVYKVPFKQNQPNGSTFKRIDWTDFTIEQNSRNTRAPRGQLCVVDRMRGEGGRLGGRYNPTGYRGDFILVDLYARDIF